MNRALIALDGNCAFLFCFLHFLPRYMPEKWLNKLSVALSHVSDILVCIALSLKYTKVEILFISWEFYMHHRLVCSACFQRQPLIFYATLNHSRHLRDFWPQISYSVSLSNTHSLWSTNKCKHWQQTHMNVQVWHKHKQTGRRLPGWVQLNRCIWQG